ncbi:MAG: MazG nucleotide pyrophosphohydrolase domain-containing protein [Syntrophotaleaceae bacterium]
MNRLIDIYRATLDKWGEEAQFDQAVEECAELIAAIKHYKREKVDRQQIIDELADVTLMVGQLAFMLGEDRVEQAIEAKLQKLKVLLAPSNPPDLP